jgi:Animal haem peroxidase
MARIPIADMLHSFGIEHPGAITLHNYPNTLRRLERIRSEEPLVDVAAVGILRDRERGVPRYNRFRTASRVFAVMASRRLKSDRFFTADYTPDVYTQEDLDWIDDNGFASVLARHYPGLSPALRGVSNPFAPWNPVDRWEPAS